MTTAGVRLESTVETAGPKRTLSNARMALYGLPNLPISVIGLPIALYVPAFYAGTLGLSLATVGTLIALSRLTDVFTDPFIGVSSDKLRTRFGRRKPFLVLGTPLMMAAVWKLFVPPAEVSNLYLFLCISALYLGSTTIQIPYRSWGAELSKDYHERSRVTGWRQAFSYGGLLMSLAIPLVLAYWLGRPGAENALLGIATVVVVLLPLLMAPTLLLVPEPAPERARRQRVDWRGGLLIVWRNDPFRRLVICLAFFTLAITMTATLSFFFVQRVMEQPFDRYASFILLYYASSSFAIPLWARLSRRFGKHRTLMLAIVWLSIWSAPIPLLRPEHYWTFVVLMVLKGSAVGALGFLPTSMAADIVDLDTVESGHARTGLYFSIWGMVLKAAVALALFLSTNVVAAFGFDPGSEANTAAAKLSVALCYSLVPAGIAVLAIPLLWRYPLDERRQKELRQQIADQQAEAVE